jgi:hypothetical protein
MAAPQAAKLLRKMPLLRSLGDDELQSIAGGLRVLRLAAGQTLFEAGTAAEGMYLVASGRLELQRPSSEPGQPPSPISFRAPGDVLAARPALREAQIPYRCQALEASEVFLWKRNMMRTFLESHPEIARELSFLGEAEQAALTQNPAWTQPGEAIYAAGRRHPFRFWRSLLLPALLLLGLAFVLAVALSSTGLALGCLGPFLALTAAGIVLWKWIDWRNDYYVLTNQRVVWLEKVLALYDARQEAPLHTVLSLSINSSLSGRWLGFGDLIIRTYTGQVTLPSISRPQDLAIHLEDLWQRERERQVEAERQEMARNLQEPHQEEQPVVASGLLGSSAERASRKVGLDRWSLELRFVEGDVITYRKHWASLLRSETWPLALAVLTLGSTVLLMAGAWPFVPVIVAFGALAALYSLAFLWGLYEFADWANDVYQISSTHILAVHKKPLGDEERQVAALDNILGTEVDRKGLLGQLLNFGNVIANVGTTQLVFEGIFNPVAAQQDLVRAQEGLIQRRRRVDLGQRRDEMVELLHIYHEGRPPVKTPPGQDGTSDDAPA